MNPKGEKGNLLRQFHSEPNLQVSSCLLWANAVGGASGMECPPMTRGQPRLRSAALVCLLLPPPPALSSILGAGERDKEVEKGIADTSMPRHRRPVSPISFEVEKGIADTSMPRLRRPVSPISLSCPGPQAALRHDRLQRL